MARECARRGEELARRAGSGYTAASPHQTGQRVAVNVFPNTKEAAEDNYKNNTLLKAAGTRV